MPAVPLPALHASHAGTWLRPGQLGANGSTRAIGKGEAIMAAADTPLLLLNAPLVATRLGYPDLSGLDLLELYAFIHPARFVVPTPKGLAHALGPLGALAGREQRARRFLEKRRHGVVARGLREAHRVGEALGSRHHEARRMDEREQLEQVEARQVRIAEPRRYQGRVEQQQRGVRRGHDRVALADRAGRSGGCAQPGAGMAGVKRGKGDGGHYRGDAKTGTKSKRGFVPVCPKVRVAVTNRLRNRSARRINHSARLKIAAKKSCKFN